MSGETEQVQATDLHRVESLDELAAQAAAMDAPAAAAPGASAALMHDTTEADLLAALRMAQAVARGGCWWLDEKQFDALWGEATLRSIAGPGAEIMRRHGWTMGDMLSKYGPYLALGGAIVPPALATIAAYKQARDKPHRADDGQQQSA